MLKNREKTHIGEVAIMLNQLSPFGSHHVPTKAAELCLFVCLFEGFYQVGCMNVAACFACYEIVLHFCKHFRLPNRLYAVISN